MPMYDKAELARAASELGFVRDTFEKVLRLKNILEFFNEDDFLSKHFALKGGTAINLTVFDLPRLSVDIDMDYVPDDSREVMMINREKATEIIRMYLIAEDYTESTESRFTHSLDAFYCQYVNAAGNRDVIKIELNYSLRAHVMEPCSRKILPSVFEGETAILTVAPIEIFAAKINALMSRAAARDLYDFMNMMNKDIFSEDRDILRKIVIYYATISAETVNVDFDTSALDKIDFSKIRRELFPVISKNDKANFRLEEYKRDCKAYIAELMDVKPSERKYMEEFIEKRYRPELLFDDSKMLERIKNHPMALWKCR